ncbi:MAG: tetratricopeptide repeat protein, partial [Thermostichales cyanobacterium SRBZ-1_bins_19]
MGSRVDNPRINKGLGLYQPDYYAALGIPITATADQINEAYKKIARSKTLRPGFLGQTTPEGQYASWLLSRLINPAKELLLKESERLEYDATLKLQVRRLMEDKSRDPYPSSPACEALRAAPDLEAAYREAVAKIASIQFDDLYGILEQAEALSELNLTFLLCRLYPSTKTTGASPIPTPVAAQPTAPSRTTGANPIPPTPTGGQRIPATNPTLTPSETRFRQAMELASKGDYKQAIQFLNFAISIDSDKPEYYYERAVAHQRLGNRASARQDYQKVLELNPKDKKAAKALQELEGSPVTPPPQQVPQRATNAA